MTLRPALLPPVVDDDVVAGLAVLVRRIVAEPRQRSGLMKQFNDVVGHAVSELQFLNHDSWSSVEEFVTHQLSMPPDAAALGAISDDEFVDMIARVQAGDGSEVALRLWTTLLETHLDEGVGTLLFHTPALGPREVLRRARLRRAVWPFAEPENEAAICSRLVLAGAPLLFVSHDDDGWFASAGEPFTSTGAAIVSLREVLTAAPAFGALADLPRGWQAARDDVDTPWHRHPSPSDDADP